MVVETKYLLNEESIQLFAKEITSEDVYDDEFKFIWAQSILLIAVNMGLPTWDGSRIKVEDYKYIDIRYRHYKESKCTWMVWNESNYIKK